MAQSFENLKVWQEAIELAFEIYAATKYFPKEEQFGITSQLRRAATSVSANIAEGSSRKSKKDYAHFVDIAIGSLYEVDNFVILSHKLSYLSKKSFDALREKIIHLGIQLGGFRKYLLK
jgi:four helix bundle protein